MISPDIDQLFSRKALAFSLNPMQSKVSPLDGSSYLALVREEVWEGKGKKKTMIAPMCCRFGDKDLQLELANPLHLRAVLEHSTFSQCRVVLLHGSYPFMREASYLAGVYPQVQDQCNINYILINLGVICV
jgi:hypothetical protein